MSQEAIPERSVTDKVSPWQNAGERYNPVTFADIISEQLSEDLQRKEDKKNSVSGGVSSVTGYTCTSECGNDEEIARTLQAQFDRQHNEMVRRQEAKLNSMSKVRVSLKNYTVQDAVVDDDGTAEEEYDDYEDMVSLRVPKKHVMPHRKQGSRKFVGQPSGSRQAEAAERKQCRAAKLAPEVCTGDSSEFAGQLSTKIFNDLRIHSVNEDKRRTRVHDSSELATCELGIEKRTRLLLLKMVSQEIVDTVNGIIGRGKESIVVHAQGGPKYPIECAIKIFSYSLGEFKNREEYMRHGFRSRNPQKMVMEWAEKEMNNLLKMRKADIKCPDIIALKKNILVMTFIGQDANRAPQLRNAQLTETDLANAWKDTVHTVKTLFNKARLVHSDLSEYNILWHDKTCWYVDVGQAVDITHPRAYKFLLRDCNNICSFFKKRGLENTQNPEELFTEVTGLAVPTEGIESLKNTSRLGKNRLLRCTASETNRQFEYFWELSKKGENTSNAEQANDLSKVSG